MTPEELETLLKQGNESPPDRVRDRVLQEAKVRLQSRSNRHLGIIAMAASLLACVAIFWTLFAGGPVAKETPAKQDDPLDKLAESYKREGGELVLWIHVTPGGPPRPGDEHIKNHPHFGLYGDGAVVFRDAKDWSKYFRVRLKEKEVKALLKTVLKEKLHSITQDQIPKRVPPPDSSFLRFGIRIGKESNELKIINSVRDHLRKNPDNAALKSLEKVEKLLFAYTHKDARPYDVNLGGDGRIACDECLSKWPEEVIRHVINMHIACVKCGKGAPKNEHKHTSPYPDHPDVRMCIDCGAKNKVCVVCGGARERRKPATCACGGCGDKMHVDEMGKCRRCARAFASSSDILCLFCARSRDLCVHCGMTLPEEGKSSVLIGDVVPSKDGEKGFPYTMGTLRTEKDGKRIAVFFDPKRELGADWEGRILLRTITLQVKGRTIQLVREAWTLRPKEIDRKMTVTSDGPVRWRVGGIRGPAVGTKGDIEITVPAVKRGGVQIVSGTKVLKRLPAEK